MTKEYKIPTDDVEYEQKITISLNHAEDDAPLSDCMNLDVDTWRDLD